MPSLEPGQYIIENVIHATLACLRDSNEHTPMSATDQEDENVKWDIQLLGNGHYLLKNIGSNTYARVADFAKEGTSVEGSSSPQQWRIFEIETTGQYTIEADDTILGWGTQSHEIGALITMAAASPENGTSWSFRKN